MKKYCKVIRVICHTQVRHDKSHVSVKDRNLLVRLTVHILKDILSTGLCKYSVGTFSVRVPGLGDRIVDKLTLP